MASKYRCYLLEQDRIAAMRVIECKDDATALIEANRILEKSPCTAAEVWKLDRRVALVSRRSSAA